jgi:hypothetical protein
MAHAFPLWRAVAALTHVGTGVAIGVAVACDEVLVALALAPLLGATLLVIAERSLGVFLVLAALAPPASVVALELIPPTETAPLWEACLACSVAGLVVVALLAPRLMRHDAPVALLAAALALILGGATTTAAAGAVGTVQREYWAWQGEQEAQRDWRAGELRLLSFGLSGGPYWGREQELSAYGIEVVHFAPYLPPTWEGACWTGYNRAAERLIRARYGEAALTHSLGCRLGGP